MYMCMYVNDTYCRKIVVPILPYQAPKMSNHSSIRGINTQEAQLKKNCLIVSIYKYHKFQS